MFVRWDNLTIAEDEGTRLPGYRDPATIRRFDAPEALDMRFYEIYAKSAINRVPEASQMPFRWTINPYRGCTHACVFCFARRKIMVSGDGTLPVPRAYQSISEDWSCWSSAACGS